MFKSPARFVLPDPSESLSKGTSPVSSLIIEVLRLTNAGLSQ